MTEVLSYCNRSLVSVVVSNTKLFARLSNDGPYLRIVGLYDTREEMVNSLMIEDTGESGPEPAVSCKIFSGSALKLSPVEQH